MELEEKVKNNAICLPTAAEVENRFVDEKAVIAGWRVVDYKSDGTKTIGISSDKLVEAIVTVRSNDWCKKRRNYQFMRE